VGPPFQWKAGLPGWWDSKRQQKSAQTSDAKISLEELGISKISLAKYWRFLLADIFQG